MSRSWQTGRVVLFQRPGILSLLALFYLVGLFVALGSTGPELWLGLALLFVFPTAGFLGIATERIASLSQSAGALALPGHARNANRFQLSMLLVLIGFPVAASAGSGRSLAVATILCGGAAAGILIARRPYFLLVVPASALVLRQLGDWWLNPYLQVGILTIELYVIARWFHLPAAAEAGGAAQVSALAGIAHEQTPEAMADAFGVGVDDIDAHERALGETVERFCHSDGRALSAQGLGFALGFDPEIRMKAIVAGTGAGCFAVLMWYFVHGQQPRGAAYWLVALFAAMAPINRASTLYEAWRRSEGEQALLSLAPSWPSPRALNRLIIGIVIACLPGGWIAWSAATSLALALDAVSFAHAMTVAAALAAISSATVTNLLVLLTRRTLFNWHLSTFLSLGIPALGALAIALRHIGGPVALGLVLIIVPPLVAAELFRRRRLQFPVNVSR